MPASQSSNHVSPTSWQRISWKDTHLSVRTDRAEAVRRAVVTQRRRLEGYIRRHPEFLHALSPITLLSEAPPLARTMAAAAAVADVGPMAAVAGALAQAGAEAALRAGAREAVVENGGDIYAAGAAPVTIGLFSGSAALGGQLALRLSVDDMPLAVCSSSGCMGHSLSLGHADLATVVASQAALADAAATRACNGVRGTRDLQSVAERIAGLPGIRAVLLAKDDRVALVGHLPELIRNRDAGTRGKITRDPDAPPVPSEGGRG